MNEKISLKEFKKKIKGIGYRFKTFVVNFSSMGFKPHRHLKILDKDKNVVNNGNCYTTETLKKHKIVFDLLNKYRGKVFDEEDDKVLF